MEGFTKPGMVYESGLIEDDEEATQNLPNIGVLLGQIIKILEYINRPEIIALKNTTGYSEHLESVFPEFANRYYGTFMMIIEGNDITPMLHMMAQMSEVKSGKKKLAQAEQNIREMLDKQYKVPR